MNITINVPDGYALTATVDGKHYTADSAKMENAALLYVLEYGFQRSVNDRTGGKDKTSEDKIKIATDVITWLQSSPFVARRRVAGESEPPINKHLRSLVRALIFSGRAEYAADKKAYNALDKTAEARNAWLMSWYAATAESAPKLHAKLTKLAESKLAEEAKLADKIAALNDD